mmetsp:Transcript_9874/g.13463  ORF Transcript_9874/g.13463 Transcript_9874/m.13463 type:complete len:193 (+) Transcript_9874:274-852(+)|eukprot:CAMPEP_0185586940 /NCGR_PEP_ID=MMETSP0434-20130131/46809_1 /TAXON_ID=626734 ORGANISM="Favella taraikaensis, Strain Fe Narragansett Bay" /NCGR_SAMPLE_ID=MMETSP0434 /ASSEMBLY_ACC=CAM_ASM_000379 /LENGTH=192 /DNA_ID=CAMNT_0028208447 /DNA_START=257 /DNA_END=835 /DNA_ORIENTATION=-
MNGNDRVFEFKAASEVEAADWVHVISLHIDESKGHKDRALAPRTEQFWRQEQISERQFLAKADTFDILLFRCNTGGGKLIRAYSRSEFDHAAMVLKFGQEPDDIFFIEATSNHGVSIKRYSSMKHTIGNFYQKIVLRHLEWSRPNEALDILEQFIEEAQQCKYNVSLDILRNRRTVNLGRPNQQLLAQDPVG